MEYSSIRCRVRQCFTALEHVYNRHNRQIQLFRVSYLLILCRRDILQSNRCNDLHGMTGEFQRAQCKPSRDFLYLQYRVYRTRRRPVLRVRRRNLQNHDRQCRVHQLFSRHVLDNNRSNGSDDVYPMSRQFLLASSNLSYRYVHL